MSGRCWLVLPVLCVLALMDGEAQSANGLT